MKTVKGLFLSLVLITACMFASCSQDELFEPQTQVQNEDVATRAPSDIFKVEEIVFPDETPDETIAVWHDAPRGVDREGNFYFVSPYSDDEGYYEGYIYKYDLSTNAFVPIFPTNFRGYPSSERFCFDENNNLCYLTDGDGQGWYGIRRIGANGLIEQRLNAFRPISMCAALNGNLFILGESTEGLKLYKLSTKGVLTEINVDLSGIVNPLSIYKANGAIIYLYDGYHWYKLNTNTGAVEEVTRWRMQDWADERAFTSSYSIANPYTIRDNYIVQMRPNAATDLIVGSIPSVYINADGQVVNRDEFYHPDLFMNADATIFYVLSWGHLYKLTLSK